MGHTSHARWSEVDRICSAHLASGEWSLEWVGHTAIWDTPTGVNRIGQQQDVTDSHLSAIWDTPTGVKPTGGEVVCSRVTRVTEAPDTKGYH